LPGVTDEQTRDIQGARKMEATSQAPLKVLIADDHPMMLLGLRRALERTESIEIVGEARSGPEVLQMVERRRPDVVLLDLRMPGMPGVECVERIKLDWPDVKTVVLSALEDKGTIDAALQAGASAYIVKSVDTGDIASVVRQAASGAVYHAPSFSRVARDSAQPADDPLLTAREHVVLAAAVAGMTTAEISKDLWVSEHTVKFHLTNIYRKLGVTNRATAISRALANGIVAVPAERSTA
jgi:DNA-binding NarL/FixJ family response regulator